jgi:WD40 repeat protein
MTEGNYDELLAELTLLRVKAMDLENELDTVALAASRAATLEAENQELQQQVKALESQNEELRKQGSTAAAAPPTAAAEVADDFIVPAPWAGAQLQSTLESANGGLNVLCVSSHPVYAELIASGGVNKSVALHSVSAGGGPAQLADIRLSAPVLSLAFSPTDRHGLLLVGCMDGSHHLIAMAARGSSSDAASATTDVFAALDSLPSNDGVSSIQSPAVGSAVARVQQSFKAHTKYVVCCKWSADGSMFATASHDKTVSIYKAAATDSSSTGSSSTDGAYEQLTKLYFPEAVEAVDFLGNNNSTATATTAATTSTATSTAATVAAVQLVVASREQPHLTYVDLSEGGQFTQSRVSLNANAWDMHVSFSVMALAVSPDGRYLLASTDKGRIIVYRCATALPLAFIRLILVRFNLHRFSCHVH